MPDTSLILHVKGTQQETTTLPKQAVRAAIAEGKISRSQLIWSPLHNAWKQVRELPHLLPSQKLAPAPQLPQATTNLPRVASAAAVPQPRVSAKPGGQPRAAAVPQPRAQVSAAVSPKQPQARPAVAAVSTGSKDYRVKEKPHFNPFKWLCAILTVLILGTIGINYLLVEQPLLAALNQTPYAKVRVYAHLGGFIQKEALDIHILNSESLTRDNFAAFMVALAKSTPQQKRVFERISLTSSFMGQYSLSGSAWKEFGDMGQADAAQQKKFLLDQLADESGQSLLFFRPNTTPEAQEAQREKVWAGLVANFVRS